MSQNRRVLIAVDGSADRDRIIEAATEYVDRSTCHIRIAIAVPPAVAGELAVLHGDAGGWPLQEMQAAFESGMTELAQAHARKFDVKVEDVMVLFGRPADELCAYCEANHIDLVVMGLHRTAPDAIGSTTLNLLQKGSCDVLAIRLGDGDSST
jgi:nucleotide-binding universal stress UspA family protein